jgi:excisionase family DNA binding protein
MTNRPSGLLNTNLVAEILACSRKTVCDLIRTKKLPAFKFGKREYKVSREEVYNYLEKCRVDAEKFYE